MSSLALLDREAVRELRAIFEFVDQNDNGSISAHEFGFIVQGFGVPITEFEVQDLIAEVDVGEHGGDGRLDFAEFCNLMTRSFDSVLGDKHASSKVGDDVDDGGDNDELERAASAAKQAAGDDKALERVVGQSFLGGESLRSELVHAFAFLDRDGDGRLNAGDLQEAFDELGDRYTREEIVEMIREVGSMVDDDNDDEDNTGGRDDNQGTTDNARSQQSKGKAAVSAISKADFFAALEQ